MSEHGAGGAAADGVARCPPPLWSVGAELLARSSSVGVPRPVSRMDLRGGPTPPRVPPLLHCGERARAPSRPNVAVVTAPDVCLRAKAPSWGRLGAFCWGRGDPATLLHAGRPYA